ncbi:MAG: diacylglycerol kinase family lipid kinase [Acidobacteria bacterium]|nr:MAG: diacylglycerol kinase family lipid kinase [Acidobacteriota bacterium]
MINAILLYNPAAGRSPLSEERFQKVMQRLQRGGICCEPVIIPSDGRDSPHLELRNKQLLIVHGGDGTIHHAIQQAAGQEICLAILPAGTANVMARELGIPLDLDGSLDVALHGTRRRISLGRSDDRYFHLMAGIGLDASVISRLNRPLKRVIGQGAYWMAGVRTFLHYQPQTFQLHLSEETLEGTFAVVANARSYGGNLRITPDAELGDPVFDVCVFTSGHRIRLLQYLHGALWGDLRHYPDVVYRKACTVRVTGPDLPIQMDGEVVGRLPANFSIFTPGIEVLVPPERSPVIDSRP